jgi:hypothetical protein
MPATLHLRLHLFKLLLLLIVQGRFQTRLRILTDSLRLAVAILWRQGLILEQCLQLLLAIRQNRFDLSLLIRTQIKRLRQMLQLPVGVHVHATLMALFLRACRRCLGLCLGLVLRVERCVRAEREHSAECNCENFVFHRSFLNFLLLLFRTRSHERCCAAVLLSITRTDEEFLQRMQSRKS